MKKGLENKKTQNLINKKFNNLTVFQISQKVGEKNRLLWDCRCDCGNIKHGVKSYDLKRSSVKSCGCMTRGRNSSNWKGYEDISSKYWNSVSAAAKRRNIKFNLKIEEAWQVYIKQNGKCAITGLDLKFSSVARSDEATASIDRIDSTKGYIKENIQWVHKWINIMKWDLTTKEFIEMCELVVNFNKFKFDISF